LNIDRETLFQFFKYTVYALLALDTYLFFAIEYPAAQVQFPGGVPAADLIEAFAATFDMVAWLVLLLMFELETYALEDRQFTPRVTWTLHGVRVLCYSFIVYAFYGYIANMTTAYLVSPLPGVSDLCSLAAEQWTYAVDMDEYVGITAANCASFSDSTSFFRFDSMRAIADGPGLRDIQYLAWVDVINAAVWLIIVVILEIDVWLQEHDKFEGLALKISNRLKFLLYSILLLAAIYWGFEGDFVDFWDAFLWLVAFFFIEMNVVEWRHEAAEEREKLPQTQ
jgi:hypothetical protein